MSLRGRLLLAAAAMVLLALVVVDATTYSQVRSYLYRQVDRSLDVQYANFRQALLNTRGPGGLVANQEVYVLAQDELVQLRDQQDGLVPAFRRRLNGPPERLAAPQLPAHIPMGDRPTYFNAPASQAGGPTFRVRAAAVDGGYQLIVALPLQPENETLHHLAGVEFGITALALLAVVALGWWLVRLSLRPLAQMEQTAAAIAEGDLDRRVPDHAPTTEVGRLARTLNTMLGRIQEAFVVRDATERELRHSEERLRRFIADASHELRTPLAAVGAYAELFERGAAGRPEDLVRVMTGIRAETARMGELVEDLLLLARLDEGRPVGRDPVELAGLAAEAVSAAAAVGPEWPVHLQATHAVEVTGDGGRVRQVVDNLLSNVRAHTPAGTSTRVRVGANGGYGVVEVADNGPGIPDEEAALVFERFYRTDSSRSRQSGGAGLGLAIVAAIVEAHNGRVAVTPTDGGGATFTVWLPLVPRPPAIEELSAASIAD